MAKKRGTPRRAKKKPARKAARRQSTALVRTVDAVPVLAPPPLEERKLHEGVLLGELGLVEIKFTPEEEKVLSEPVDPHKVLVKPNGAPYLPHAEYTRWMNRALGRGAWSLVPVGQSAIAQGTVVVPYVLFIHGKPAAFAMGEQEFFEGNKNQTYGDALESTVASALRRCTKHLGVGLELWDKEWLTRWLFENTIAVKVSERQRDGSRKNVTRRRRKIDPPLPWEVGPTGPQGFDDELEQDAQPARQAAPRTQPRAQAPQEDVGHHARSGEPISAPQAKRLAAIIRNSGRESGPVLEWIKRAHGFSSLEKVTRDRYDAICNAIEAPADLPEGRR